MTLPPTLGSGTVVVRAWAPWCSNCRAMEPRVREVAAKSSVALVDLRVDDEPELTERLAIRSVPTLLVLRDGAEIGRLVGAQPLPAIESLFVVAHQGGGTPRSGSPRDLVAGRLGAGLAAAGAGVAFGSVPLLVVGAALGGWGFAGVARRMAGELP